MKIITASLLVFSIMLITFSKSIISVQHELNKKYIASALCENRDKPMAHCNGACHLKKTMNNDGQKESVPGSTVKSVLEVELFSVPSDKILFNENFTNNTCSVYSIAAFVEPCFSVFHPPKVA